MTPDPLHAVRRAARAKRRAELAYHAALEHARSTGLSYADIARAAGITRQAVRQQLAGRGIPAQNVPVYRETQAERSEP